MQLPRLLDVVTINVWGLPWPFARDRARRYARIARHFERRPYHLVGVQEAWWPLGRSLRIPGLRFGPRVGDSGLGLGDSGLGLGGSLAPEGPHDVVPFARASGADRLARKGLLVARVGVMTVAVTHLQAGEEVAVRAHQVEQIVERLAGERGPVVLMGDFNFSPADRASEDRLGAAGLCDVGATSAAPTFHGRNPFAAGSHPQRYDRIYVRDGGGLRFAVDGVRVLPRIWSDHQPVHASLVLG